MKTKILLLVILFYGLILRLYLLKSNPSFWLDEAFVYQTSKLPLIDIIKGNYWDFPSHPPITYIIIKFASLFSIDEKWLRFPSLTASLLSILGIYWLCLALFKRKKIALIASYIFSLSTYNMRFSTEAKFYSLVLFFEIFSLLYFVKIIKDSKSNYNQYLFVMFSFLALLTDYSFFWLFFVYILFIAISVIYNNFNLNKNKILLFGLLLIILLFLPWLPKFIKSLPTAYALRTNYVQIPKLPELPSTILTYLSFYQHKYANSVPEAGWYESLTNLIKLNQFWAAKTYNVLNYFLLASTIFYIIKVILNCKKDKNSYLLILLIIFLPLSISFIFSVNYSIPLYIHYNLMFVQIGLILLLSVSIYDNLRLGIVILLLYVILNGLSYNTLFKYQTIENLRGVYSYITSKNLGKRITLLFYPEYYDVIFDYYGDLNYQQYNINIGELNYPNLSRSSNNLCLIYNDSFQKVNTQQMIGYLDRYFTLISKKAISSFSISCYTKIIGSSLKSN